MVMLETQTYYTLLDVLSLILDSRLRTLQSFARLSVTGRRIALILRCKCSNLLQAIKKNFYTFFVCCDDAKKTFYVIKDATQ